jgi:toxin ParE1/3/4
MAEYRLSPAAERDLESIWKYTLGEWGLEQADRYTDLLTAAFQALAESPKSAPACDHSSAS